MKMPSYKTCAVPLCKNTTIKVPNKLFIHVPSNCPKRRKKWLELAHRDPKLTSDKAPIFFCEDHFDLPNDMENYMQYYIMGSVTQIRMKTDCFPLKYECQPDRRTRSSFSAQRRKTGRKRQHMNLITEILSKHAEISATSSNSSSDFQPTAENSLLPTELVSVEVAHLKEEPEWNDKIDTQTLLTKFEVKEEWESEVATENETEGANAGHILCEVKEEAVCRSQYTKTEEDGETGCTLYKVKMEFASDVSEQYADTANGEFVLGP